MLENIQDFGLKQLITESTRISSSSSTLIDIMLTDCDHLYAGGVLNIKMSDHLPIYYVKKKSREHNPKESINGRSYKQYVKESFQNGRVNVTPHHQMRHKSHTKVLSKCLNKKNLSKTSK